MLRSVTNSLQRFANEGVVLVGEYDSTATTDSVTLRGNFATVEDCAADGGSLQSASTGEVVDPDDGKRNGVRAHMEFDDGDWKTAELEFDEALCAQDGPPEDADDGLGPG